MTKETSEILTFTVPINAEAHRLAQQFYRQQSDRSKAKQVYLNTLAVSAVTFYLRCMGIETNWEASLSCHPIFQTFMDVADLEIPNLGKLECRPVLPEVNAVLIPPEAWSDRIGYVAVQLDSSLQEATLLGFTKTAPESGELPISQLYSLANFLEYLHQIRHSKSTKMRINLSQWFKHLFETSWQSLDTLLATEHYNLALSLRSASPLGDAGVRRAKLIDLRLQLASQSVVLLVAIAPEADEKVAILVQLHPTGKQTYLPPEIKLALVTETGETLQEVQSRSQDNYIQLRRFRCQPGECFNIEVAVGDARVTESFTI